MRKIYLLSFLFICLINGNAQVNLPQINLQPINHPYEYNPTKIVNNKTVSCIDTVRYPQSKTTSLLYDTMDYVTYIGAVSQAYHFSGTGVVHGISAYMLLDLDGIAGNFPPVSMVISVRNIDSGNVPTSIIASDTVLLYDVGYEEQVLMFSALVAVSDSFAVVIEIDTLNPSNPYYITNNYGEGLVEELSSLTYTGIWYNLYPTWGGTWDVDMIISPIISQDITSSYTTDKDSICSEDSVVFTNTSVNCTDRMFNGFNTTTNPLYTWDFNDGTGTYNFTDTTYTFNSSGSYNTQLTTTYYGYSLNCNDISNHIISVFDTAIANFGFSYSGVGIFQFTDSSYAASTYYWDFGDGSNSVDQNTGHMYTSPGNYQVCLTVVDTNGCNSNTICNTISFTVGVDDFYAADYVKVYPIPANKYFNVTVPNNYFGGDIIITDVVGQQLKSVAIETQDNVKVLTEGIASGIYFVSIDYNGERVFTKRIVIDK